MTCHAISHDALHLSPTTAGVDYELVNKTLHFPSYLSIYGHLSAEQVAQFAVSPPVATQCVDVRIIDDDVLERISSKTFRIELFSEDAQLKDRIVIESNVSVTIEDDDREFTVCVYLSVCVCVCVCVYKKESV